MSTVFYFSFMQICGKIDREISKKVSDKNE